MTALSGLLPQAGSVPTIFVLLHLYAAVIDELESTQASHLLIHTQVLARAKRGRGRESIQN